MEHPQTSKIAIRSNAELIVDWARKGAALGDCGRMCSNCAFKPGTEPNGSEQTVALAAQAVAYEMQVFGCYKPERKGEPCKGYLYARQHLKKRFGNEQPKSKHNA